MNIKNKIHSQDNLIKSNFLIYFVPIILIINYTYLLALNLLFPSITYEFYKVIIDDFVNWIIVNKLYIKIAMYLCNALNIFILSAIFVAIRIIKFHKKYKNIEGLMKIIIFYVFKQYATIFFFITGILSTFKFYLYLLCFNASYLKVHLYNLILILLSFCVLKSFKLLEIYMRDKYTKLRIKYYTSQLLKIT